MRENMNKPSLEISEALLEFYVPYASYVIQTRALPDARDGLKTGARFILYAQYKEKITFKNKRRKATATKSAAMMFSPHGDASIYGNAVRMSQNFSLRYPLIDTHGNNGSLMHNNDYAADRYLEMRSGEIADEMTRLLTKETVDKWKLNYTEEELYPTYLPTTFPNSLVNGNFGIGVSLASSIPSHNLNDVSEAVIKAIDNPNVSFEDIYCPIDFPTGGIIINENQVKESLRNGHGPAAIIRANVEYDSDKNEIIVRDLPYMVFSANATMSIQQAIDDGKIMGIESVFDGTDYDGVKIVIKLSKNANLNKILKLLYKHTLLQSSFSINMNALDEGKYPKTFTWTELVMAYVKHLKDVIRKSFLFDLKQIKERIHILEGLIIAIINIEEVVKIIKNSSTPASARQELSNRFGLSDKQTKAILDLKLSRLANLELQKIKNEKSDLEKEKEKIEEILNNETKFNTEVKSEVLRIKNKYGDERKTKNISLDFSSEEEDAEPIEKKELLIHYTNLGNFYTQESTTLLTSRRGAKGTKVKLAANEVIVQTINDNNFNSILAFSNKGKMYFIAIDDLPINSKANIAQLCSLEGDETITTITSLEKKNNTEFFVFITKNGLVKKTKAKEYEMRRGKSIKAINLKDNDEVVEVLFINNENIGILSSDGNFITIETSDINSIGRVAAGIKGIKLNKDSSVIAAKPIKNLDKMLISISKNGLIKKTDIEEFPLCNKNTKGRKIAGVRDGDLIVDFLTIKEDCDIINISSKKTLKINSSELRVLSRDATGVKALELDNGYVVKILKS